MATTALDLITFAFVRMGTYASSETIADADAEDCLTILNDMLDSWSNEELTCFANLEQSIALTANKQTYTIGTGGDINGTRPLRISNEPGTAYIQDVNGQNYPLSVVEQDIWNQIGNRSSNVTANVPNTLFYDSQYPLGKLSFYPMPNIGGFTAFWDSRLQLTDFAALSTAFSFPPGYKMALQSNLVLEAWAHFKPEGSSPSAPMIESARQSKANVKRSNKKEVIAQYDKEIVTSGASGSYNIYVDGPSR